MRRVLKTLTVLFLLIISMVPIARPVNALGVHTYYLGSSTVGSCSGRCEMLTTAAVPGIVVDNLATSAVSTDSSGLVTISFTVGTGANRLLIVGGTVDNFAITGVTYGGTALTQAVADTQKPTGSIWYLVNPPSGTASVVVTSTPSKGAIVGVISFTGVDQSTPIPTTATNDNANGRTSPATVSITNANANSWVMDLVGSGHIGAFTNGASTTTQWNLDSGSTNAGASSTTGPLSPSTVTNFSWTLPTPDAWVDVAVEIKPFAGTSQIISTTTGNFMVEPDISASATGTPTTSTQSGYAWETPSAIGAQIVSGIWNFDLTVGSSASTGTASVWITVWNCQTSSEGTCAFFFKNWDNTTNVISTAATKRTYVTGTIGPFNNIQFLVVEYWLHVPVAGASGETVRETTVTAASDVGTPGFLYSYSLPESPTVSDSPGKLFQGLRAPPGESPVVSDSSTKLFQGFRTDSETPPLSDAMVRLFTGFRALAEMPTISDAMVRVFTGFRGLTESLAGDMTDSISKSAGKFVFETPALSDATDRLFTGFRSLTETPTISDIASRLFAGFRGLTESPTVSDAIARLFAGVRSLTETPTISDAVSRAFTGFRGLTESLASTIADSISKGAGKFPLESLVPSDVVGRVFTGFRTTSEDLASTIADVVNRGLVKSLSEVVSIADSVSRGVGKFPLVSLVPSDVVGRVFTGARSISDNSVSVVSDSVTRAFTGFRSTAESLVSAIADSVSKAAAKFPLESLVPSDVVGRAFTGARSISDNSVSVVSDSVSRAFTGFRTTSECRVSAITDSFIKIIRQSPRSTLVPSAVVGRVFTGARSISDNSVSVVSDSVTRAFTGFRSTAESLVSAITDSISKGAGKFALVSLVPSDVVGRVFAGFRTLTEIPTVSDTASRVLDRKSVV